MLDEYGLEFLVEPQNRPIGGFDIGEGPVGVPLSEDELTTLYAGIRGGSTNFFTILSRGGYERKADEENWLKETPLTFDTIEVQAAWYVLRKLGFSDPRIAKFDYDERQLRFRTELQRAPESYVFSRQRLVAEALLALAKRKDLRA